MNLVVLNSYSDYLFYKDKIDKYARYICKNYLTFKKIKRGHNELYLNMVDELVSKDEAGLGDERVLDITKRWFLSDNGADISAFMGVSIGSSMTMYIITQYRELYRLILSYSKWTDSEYYENVYLFECCCSICMEGEIFDVLRAGDNIYQLDCGKNNNEYYRDILKIPLLLPKFRWSLKLMILSIFRVFDLFSKRTKYLAFPDNTILNILKILFLDNRKGEHRWRLPSINLLNMEFFLNAVKSGVLPLIFKPARLDKGDMNLIGHIRRGIEKNFEARRDNLFFINDHDFKRVFFSQIKKTIFSDIETLCRMIKTIKNTVESNKIGLIIFNSVLDPPENMLSQVAKELSIKTIFIYHGIIFVEDVESSFELNSIGLVDYVSAISSPLKEVLKERGDFDLAVPHPYLGKFIPLKEVSAAELKKALLFFNELDMDTLKAKRNSIDIHLEGIIKMLHKIGVEELIIKPRFNPTIYNEGYIEKLLNEMELPESINISVSYRGNASSLIRWCDFAVGTLSTTCLDTLLMGKPFYLFDFDQCSLSNIYKNYLIEEAHTVGELEGRIRDRNYGDMDKFLSVLKIDYSTKEGELEGVFYQNFRDKFNLIKK